MTDRELRGALLTEPVPGELEAQRRAWPLVRAAFEAREPVSWARRRTRPLVAFAVALALVAAAFTPPGRAVASWLRDTVAPPEAPPISLPASGRLLVVTADGPWIVQKDGSKRLLGAYEDAAWSPRGLFVVATRGRTLVALEPTGRVRWTIAAPAPASDPRWSPSGFRIAYRSGSALRVVAGDGSPDRLLARSVAAVAPAWRPGPEHVLAFADAQGRITIVNVDTGAGRLRTHSAGAVRQLAWSPDGSRLLVAREKGIDVYDRSERRVQTIALEPGHAATTVVFAPRGRTFAFTDFDGSADRSSVRVTTAGTSKAPRTLFAGAGRFDGLAWSPDGRWVAVGWPGADQWMFVRAPRVRKVATASAISREFDPGGRGTGGFARIVSWCCY